MTAEELKYHQQQSTKKCSTCNKPFYSRIPERGLQFCSEQCECIYMEDVIAKMYKESAEKAKSFHKKQRETTY